MSEIECAVLETVRDLLMPAEIQELYRVLSQYSSHTLKRSNELRHFIAYHNAEAMGYSCTAIPEPRAKTSRPVAGLDGATVWLIAGEGRSPKSYYLAARFIASRCLTDFDPGSKLPNQIAGIGRLYEKDIPISGKALLKLLQKDSANFVRGFYETDDAKVISGLESLV